MLILQIIMQWNAMTQKREKKFCRNNIQFNLYFRHTTLYSYNNNLSMRPYRKSLIGCGFIVQLQRKKLIRHSICLLPFWYTPTTVDIWQGHRCPTQILKPPPHAGQSWIPSENLGRNASYCSKCHRLEVFLPILIYFRVTIYKWCSLEYVRYIKPTCVTIAAGNYFVA